jgi:Rrf2 family protein
MFNIRVMRMGQGVEWALHACHLLAALPPGSSLSSGQLAEFFALPAPYLSKHLQALSRAGVTVSVPGPQGGYRLARPATEISLLAVVEAIEGSVPAFRCTEIRQRGPASLPQSRYGHPCAIASAMARAEAAWRRELEAVTVADIMATVGRRAPAAAAAARAWLARAGGASPAAGDAGRPPNSASSPGPPRRQA